MIYSHRRVIHHNHWEGLYVQLIWTANMYRKSQVKGLSFFPNTTPYNDVSQLRCRWLVIIVTHHCNTSCMWKRAPWTDSYDIPNEYILYSGRMYYINHCIYFCFCRLTLWIDAYPWKSISKNNNISYCQVTQTIANKVQQIIKRVICTVFTR